MADEYELGTVGPIPTVNPNVAKIGEMLKLAKKYADQYYVKDYVPLIGGTTLGEFLLGKAPEEVERWGQGDSPFRNPNEVVRTGGNRLDVWKAGRFEPTFDVVANVALPAIGTGQMAARPIARTLGPKAAEMAEDYLTKQGAIANIVEPSPKKVVEPFSAIDELGFHSPLENAILKIQQPKGTGDQFLKQLEKTPGVKTEELDVTGIKQYLLDHPTVTKQELLDQMATSRLKLQQTVLGKGSGENVYDEYRLQGGDVYHDDDYISALADDFFYDMKTDDVLRSQEREALLKSDPDLFADNPLRLEDAVDDLLEEQAKKQAYDMYYENPINRYHDDYGYEIYGNDEMGYTFKSPEGEFLNIGNRNGTYDISDAETALADYHLELGRLNSEEIGAAKFEDYTLPGKYENYREVLTTLPEKGPKASNLDEAFAMWMADAKAGKRGQYTPEELASITKDDVHDILKEEYLTANRKANFSSSHFDEPNILAHTRLNDRIINGKKTLMVEEIQSDWHQAGRRKGYQSGKDVEKQYENLMLDMKKQIYDEGVARYTKEYQAEPKLRELMHNIPVDEFADRAAKTHISNMKFDDLAREAGKYDEWKKLYDDLAVERHGVPDAPFKKNWHELMMKQILNEAVNGGYDAVAFTTGKQQAARYNLSKQIDSIDLIPAKEGDKQYVLQAWKNGNNVIRKAVNEDELPDLIGKEPAKRLLEQNPTGLHRPEGIAHGNPNVFEGRELKGLDLDVGGEGMKGFYDKILPDYINKYGKKYGIAVKKEYLTPPDNDRFMNFKDWAVQKDPSLNDTFLKHSWNNKDDLYKEFLNTDRRGDEVHYFDLSDMAKKDIKEKGQPLFSGIGLAPAPLLFDEEDN
jgi:hypothetical protein